MALKGKIFTDIYGESVSLNDVGSIHFPYLISYFASQSVANITSFSQWTAQTAYIWFLGRHQFLLHDCDHNAEITQKSQTLLKCHH